MILHKCSLWNVASVFFVEPTQIHFIKEISRKIKLAHTSVNKHLSVLLELGLIEKASGEIYRGYRAKRDNPEFIFYKKMSNLISLKESGLIEELKEKYPKSVIVFGSYNKGEDIETSDIDLFIDSDNFRFNAEKYEQYLSRKLHILFRKESGKLKESINQGVILFGER